MLSLSALFGVMMAPAFAVLVTSLIVRLFEHRLFEKHLSNKKFDAERSLFRSDLAESKVS